MPHGHFRSRLDFVENLTLEFFPIQLKNTLYNPNFVVCIIFSVQVEPQMIYIIVKSPFMLDKGNTSKTVSGLKLSSVRPLL